MQHDVSRQDACGDVIGSAERIAVCEPRLETGKRGPLETRGPDAADSEGVDIAVGI